MAAYLKTTGPAILGQANDSEHVGWIPVLSMRQSVDRHISRGVGGLPRVGASSFGDVLVVTKVGRHLPELQAAVATGTCFEQIQIDFGADTGAGRREVYYQVSLSDVHVTNLQVENVALSEVADTVLMQLNYQRCEMAFRDVSRPGDQAISGLWSTCSKE